jgi:hypothetical protein
MSKIVHVIKPEHKRIFYSFLKANNALKQFKRNCRYRGREMPWLTSPSQYYIEDIMDYAFYWAEQPEGAPFWRSLNEKWRKYIRYRMNF